MHGVNQSLAVEHVDVEMMGMLGKITVQQSNQVFTLVHLALSKSPWNHAESVGDTVPTGVVIQFGNRVERGESPGEITAVHRVSPRRKRLALSPTAWRAASFFAVDDIGGDSQY